MGQLSVSEWFYSFTRRSFIHFSDIRRFFRLFGYCYRMCPVIRNRFNEKLQLSLFSRDISEFWRRWHISLSTWFRDYIYIPLGGSRCKKTKVIRNYFHHIHYQRLWHGANWTFILWGIYHALLFMPLLLLNKNRRYTKNVIVVGKLLPSFKEAVQMFSTFFLVLIGWIISGPTTSAKHPTI